MTEPAADVIEEFCRRFNERFEWLAVFPDGAGSSFARTEVEVETSHSGSFLGLPTARGFRRWRIRSVDFDREDIVVALSGPFGQNLTEVRLIPRTPASELTREIEAARLKKANETAEMFERALPPAKAVRCKLREAGGRLAEIILKLGDGSQMAILRDVTEKLSAESLLSSLLVWRRELNARRKKPVDLLAIACTKKTAREADRLRSLLRQGVAESILIFKIEDDVPIPVAQKRGLRLAGEKITRTEIPADASSHTAESIRMRSPEQIDIVASAHGETIRFNGLPFARVRRLAGAEQSWFGVGKRRRLLTSETEGEFAYLLDELIRHRAVDAENRRHDLFRAAPEAWLESILKRNIKLLDANLILSPIYDQFRFAMRKIDLLALRRDGRLAIVEIKTSPDREMVFQAAGYWRRIEVFRRKGEIERSGLFGDRKILDRPTIVYTVAPALAFHRDFELFASALSSEIELWRFELHEDWRPEIKVIARKNYSD